MKLNIRIASTKNRKDLIIKKTKSGCWECVSHKPNKSGYVHIQDNGKMTLVHRLSYIHYKGFPPKGKPCVLHKCDNPLCCNPKHLWAGTHKDNMSDMSKKGRSNGSPPRGVKNYNAKLKEKEVIEIRMKYKTGRYTLNDLAEEYGISNSMVSYIHLNRNWTHI